VPRKPDALAGVTRSAQPIVVRLGRILQLRSDREGLSGPSLACGRSSASVPPASAQAARGEEPLHLRRGLWEGGCAEPASEASARKTRACLLVKSVREPDAGNPQVR